ncbi:stearoyl-CoA 9-desaturase [Sarracenia purpurea var. burkii]
MAEPKKYITLEALNSHNKPGDLWISIEGKVYDVSDWAKNHPGGSLPLFNLAGQDVTDPFTAYHPAATWQYLDKFFNGHYLEDYSVTEVSKDYRNLTSEFSKMGLFEKKGHDAFISLCCMAILFAAGVFGVLRCSSTWVHFLSGASIGVFWILGGLIGHESGHYQVMPTKQLNQVAQILIANCSTGISIGWWKWHHYAHHICVNSLDFDPDVQHLPLFAVSSKLFESLTSYFDERKMNFDPITRFLVSYQHWTFYPVMCIARVTLWANSFIMLFSKRKVPNRVYEILGLLLFWIWYPLLISFLPNWGERIMFVIGCSLAMGLQHVQFCLNHFASSLSVGPPQGNNWLEEQTRGSLNITCPSWMDWFHGGLQFHTEHHLFPRLPRRQLRKISPFVVELCKKHNVKYNTISFWKANALTIRTLQCAAMLARDLTNPVPKNLVWEAVSTQG